MVQVDANIDPTFLPKPYQDWILGDTYVLDGLQHLFLFHQPSKQFVPLARLRNTGSPGGILELIYMLDPVDREDWYPLTLPMRD